MTASIASSATGAGHEIEMELPQMMAFLQGKKNSASVSEERVRVSHSGFYASPPQKSLLRSARESAYASPGSSFSIADLSVSKPAAQVSCTGAGARVG